MDMLTFAAIIAGLALPLHLSVRWQLDRLCDPRAIRRSGAAIDGEHELDASAEVIGYYDGRRIYAWVQFMGMRYRFDRVAPPWYRHWVGERELFLDPGLVYLTD